MTKAAKGSEFEREICKKISLWWTNDERDDVFWRSAQSGGRATQRAKSGKKTHGSYGDLTALDPIGEPLLKVWTMEMKRGSSVGVPGDLFDTRPTRSVRPFEAAIYQAYLSHKEAGSEGWMIIAKRDFKVPVVYVDSMTVFLYGIMDQDRSSLVVHPNLRYNIEINIPGGVLPVSFWAFRLDDFLQSISPDQIIEE